MKGKTFELNENTLSIIEEIGGHMPGGFFIYRADDPEELIYANKAVLDIYGCASLEEFRALTGYTFRGMVYPEDYDRISSSIVHQISSSEDQMDYAEYRIVRRDGAVRWVDDYGHYAETRAYGGIYVVFISDITDKKLQYRFSDTDTPKTFAEDAVIYAVYKIKGYELTLTKQVLGDSAGEKTFTFEVSSDKLTYNTYDTSTGQVTANSNKITVTVQRGASVTIYGLLSGAYTIKETTAGIYEMTAKVNGTDAIVNGTTVAASINSNTEVKVINTYPIPITGAGEQSTPYVVVTAVVLLTAAILVFICKRKGEKRNELSSL